MLSLELDNSKLALTINGMIQQISSSHYNESFFVAAHDSKGIDLYYIDENNGIIEVDNYYPDDYEVFISACFNPQ
jgi:hypothetical protein